VSRLRFIALCLWAVGVQVHELLATVGLALFFLAALPTWRASWFTEWRPLFAFIAWALLMPTAAGHLPAGEGVARTLDWLTIPVVAAAGAELTPSRWRVLIGVSLGVLLVSSVVAGLQHVGVWPPLSAFDSLSWTRTSFYRVYEPIADSGRFMGGGLLFHRLKFAHVSALFVIGAVVAARFVEGRARVAVIALGLAGFVAVWLFPYARMGAVAMTAGVGLTVVLVSPSPRKALLVSAGLGVLGVVAVLAIAPLRDRFASALTDQGSGQRTQHLSAGIAAVKLHPIVGVGPGQFRPSKFGDASMAEHVKDNPGKAHNQFVSMAAETGIPGALLFIAMLVWLVMQARKSPYGALTIGAIASFAVLSLAHDPLFQAPVSMGLVLVIGLGLTRGDAHADQQR